MLSLLIAAADRSLPERIGADGVLPAEISSFSVCFDGVTARQRILTEDPDIVIMDPDLKGLSGIRLLSDLQYRDGIPQFILISESIPVGRSAEAMRLGVRRWLTFSCQDQELFAALADASAVSRANVSRLFSRALKAADAIGPGSRPSDPTVRRLLDILNSILDIRILRLTLAHILLNQDRGISRTHSMLAGEFLTRVEALRSREEILSAARESIEQLFGDARTSSRRGDFIDRTLQYVDQHLSEPDLSLKNIAQNYLFMNEDYVSKQFLRQTGVRFSAYLANARVERAKLLLLKENASVYSVAEEVGFGNNPQYFTQIFKKCTGMTPTAYMRSLKGV